MKAHEREFLGVVAGEKGCMSSARAASRRSREICDAVPVMGEVMRVAELRTADQRIAAATR